MSATVGAPRTRGAVFRELTVAAVDRLTDDAVAVTFDVPPELSVDYAFSAGQSLTLRRFVDGREERRTYSICATEGDRPRVGVREIPDGLFSRWLVHEVRPGDTAEVQTPSGRFCLDAVGAAEGRHLLVGAGSGITPLLSLASTILRTPTSRVTLLYGNRTTQSVMFADEIADLKDRHGARLDVVHVLSREPRDVELFSGRLDAERLRRLVTMLVPWRGLDHIWLCGPWEMTNAARAMLEDLGVDARRVHTELFHVDEPPPPLRHPDRVASGVTSEVTVVLDGREATTALPRDRTILDGAQTTRADLPFACKGGVCGTCRARVTDGEVDLVRNYALEADELDAGFVLTCQSYPVSDRVTVDYDA